MSASRSYSPPLDPILRGPPMREAGNHRKGAGGHGIGFRSITAAAERPVTFGWHFSWLKARLLRGLGSSAVQRIGGRPSVPSPQNTGTTRSFRRGRSQTGPRAHIVRPCGGKWTQVVGLEMAGAGAGRQPLKFLHAQAPVGRLEFRHPLRFCAPEGLRHKQESAPVMGDRGPTPPVRGRCREATKGVGWANMGAEAPILSRPPAILKVNCPEGAREGGLGHWFLSHRWERNSPPALRPQARQGELVRRTKRRPPGGFGAQPPRSGGS